MCSLIGAWIANGANNFFQSDLIYGDTRATTISIKYICLLLCFLLAFSCFVQSVRHFVHATYLISTPDCYIPVSSVETAVIRGDNFWSLGLRALYFALDLLLWFFGPIPMFICSVIMVLILHLVDSNSRPLHNTRSLSQGSPFQKARKEGYIGINECLRWYRFQNETEITRIVLHVGHSVKFNLLVYWIMMIIYWICKAGNEKQFAYEKKWEDCF